MPGIRGGFLDGGFEVLKASLKEGEVFQGTEGVTLGDVACQDWVVRKKGRLTECSLLVFLSWCVGVCVCVSLTLHILAPTETI